MKIRTDFVTNSSSSSFMVSLDIEPKEGFSMSWRSPWYSCEDNGEIHIKKSPKEMGQCETIEQLVSMLFKEVSANGEPVFNEDSYFIKKIRGLSSMEDIKSISLSGNEQYVTFDSRTCSFKYDLESKTYKMKQCGEEMESEGTGGELHIKDYKQATIDADSDIECVVKISLISTTGEESSIKLSGSNSSLEDDWNDYKSFAISYMPESLNKCQSLDDLKVLLDEMIFADRKPVNISQNLICNHPSIHTIEDASSLIIELDQRLYFDWDVRGKETYEYSFKTHTTSEKQSGIKFEHRDGSLVEIYDRKLEFSDFEIKDGILEKYYGKDKHVEIPKGVISIGSEAFNECLSLESVIISDGVTSIGEYAFGECSNLVSVEIPDSVERIEKGAFIRCTRLEDIKIPDSVIEIEEVAFYCCTNLAKVELPESITSIRSNVFGDCRKLTNVVLPGNLQNIDSSAFCNCGNLREVIIPSKVTNIYDAAFLNCYNLEKVILPEGLKSISSYYGPGAFENCKKLKEIKIPSSVVEIDHITFRGCSKSLKIEFADSTYANMGLKPMLEFVLNAKQWSKLPEDIQASLFMRNQGKTVFSAYKDQTSPEQAEKLGRNILNLLLEKPTQKNCNTIANFMLMFADVASVELLLEMHETIKNEKAGKKALATIEGDAQLMKRLGV